MNAERNFVVNLPARRGLATSTLIGIIVAVLLLGGVAYYLSDPFSTRVKKAYSQFAEWTPENIAKDPEGYLDFCEQQTKKALEDLKADKVRWAQSRSALESMRDGAAQQVSAGEAALKQLVPAFKAATTSESTEPVQITWRDKKLTKAEASRQIMTLDREVERQKKIRDNAVAGLRKLEVEGNKLADLEDKAKAHLQEIATNRQMLAVNKLTDNIKTQLVNMQAALSATVNAVQTTDGTVSLADLTAETAATTVDESKLNETMSKYGG